MSYEESLKYFVEKKMENVKKHLTPNQPTSGATTDDDLPTLLENEIVRTVSLDLLHQRAATEIRRLRAALYSQPATMPEWEDQRVQIAYGILCDTETEPPEGEHWEGFAARRIVAALAPAQPVAMTDERADAIADAHRWDTRAGRRQIIRAALSDQVAQRTNQCGETCERAKVCATCAGEIDGQAAPKVQEFTHLCGRVKLSGPREDVEHLVRLLPDVDEPEARAQAVPIGWKLYAIPQQWTPGANVFKNWCAYWFGPDSDDDYLMRAVNSLIAAATQPPAPSEQRKPLTQAARDVLSERQRQISIEGWTPEHDDEHDHGELAAAAASYADPQATPPALGGACYIPLLWPRQWDTSWWRPRDKRRNLVKAGALILAEIERLDRAALRSTGGDQSCES